MIYIVHFQFETKGRPATLRHRNQFRLVNILGRYHRSILDQIGQSVDICGLPVDQYRPISMAKAPKRLQMSRFKVQHFKFKYPRGHAYL